MSAAALLGALAPMASQAHGAPDAADPAQPAQPQAGEGGVADIVVTAQRRSESIQSVPFSIAALGGDALKERRIEGGNDLPLAIPNVSFSRGHYGNYNFQIRGIGTKPAGTGSDVGVSAHENNVPMMPYTNTLGDAEFFDVERVEVLRGPQGTLYGRNATGGVVNVITAKPTNDASGSLTAEVGSYRSVRLRGFVNLPLGDLFSARLAGFMLKRDGFATNVYNGENTDGRDLWAFRGTLDFHPNDNFHSYIMWERFREDDNRDRIGKQLCIHDGGMTSIGGVATNTTTRNMLSKGCATGSLYSSAAFQSINTAATYAGVYAMALGIAPDDLNKGVTQSTDLHSYASSITPVYQSNQNIVDWASFWNVTPSLLATLQVSYSDYKYHTFVDELRTPIGGTFSSTALTPGGVLTDPLFGSANTFRWYNINDNRYPTDKSSVNQWTAEFRLASSFKGPFNFSVGANWIRYFDRSDTYSFNNVITAYARSLGISSDSTYPLTGDAHNYSTSQTDYHLLSKSIFGEVYVDIAPTLKFTGGLRYNDDHKSAKGYIPQYTAAGYGLPNYPVVEQNFREITGRANLQWSPDIGFTDRSMFYANYARGYKPGGFNSPSLLGVTGVPRTYKGEFVNSFELGTKNTLLGGRLQLNLDGFYYSYKGYQISKQTDSALVTENVDAKIYGLEFDTVFEPVRHARLNLNVGYLHTEVTNASSIDVANRTQGDPDLVSLKSLPGGECVANVADVAAVQSMVNTGTLPAYSALFGPSFYVSCNGLQKLGYTTRQGVVANLSGNEMPNSPHWTISAGAQYAFQLADGWSITPRVDVYGVTDSYARIYNAINDKLKGYTLTNVSITVEKPELGLTGQIYVRNLFDKDAITDTFVGDASRGLYTNIFVTDPRVVGVSLTKNF